MENCITNQHGRGNQKKTKGAVASVTIEFFFHPSQAGTLVLNEGRENNISSVWRYALKAC